MDQNSTYRYSEDIFEIIRRYEKTNFWYVSRRDLILWAVEKYFLYAKTVLDVGCGTGFNLEGIHARYPTLDLYGCDASPRALQISRSRLPQADFNTASVYDLDTEGKYDLVMALDVLEHLDDDGLALQKIHGLLATNGGAIITVPQHPFLWSPADEYAHHVRRYTRAALIRRVTEAGFSVVRATSYVTTLFPLMITSRMFDRIFKRPYEFEKELAVTRLSNLIFRNFLSLERNLIKLGFSLPFGGSLMLVVQK